MERVQPIHNRSLIFPEGDLHLHYVPILKSRSVVCQKNHVWLCITFLSLTVKDRFRMASSKGHCFRCLEAGQTSQSCDKPPCKHCQGRHHSLHHVESVSSGSSAELPHSPPTSGVEVLPHASPSTATSLIVTSCMATNGGDKVILQTIPDLLCGSNGCSKVVWCFLDPGSQTSFVK